MALGQHQHVRRSIRLRGYDYSRAGAYFVTICTGRHACLFGEILDSEMHLNHVGRIVKDEWFRTGTLRTHVRVLPQEFVFMPNHVHGIVWFLDLAVDAASAQTSIGAPVVPTDTPSSPRPETIARPAGPPRGSLAALLAGFKAASTKRVNAEGVTSGASIWQRGYYEHVIRNDQSLDEIRRYIAENPARWAVDRENPSCRGDRW